MLLKYLGFCWSKDTSSSRKHYPTSSSRKYYPSVIEELCCHFSLAYLRISTNNFDENQIIGQGGMGTVYKGCLQHNDAADYTVALMRMHESNDEQFKMFKNEIELLCQLRHPNLVSLIGFCLEEDEMIIVYEYMPNGSLYDHLHRSGMEPLSWKQRLKICIGAARVLHYLHTGTKRPIFHRDINPRNILLDNNMIPKLSDFGLSKMGPLFTSKRKPMALAIEDDGFVGTYGYTAPELLYSLTITDKCNVFSFGVVLLDVVCTDTETARNVLFGENPVEENIVPNLKGKIAPECWEVFMDITKRCVAYEPDERPIMGEVEVQLEHALSLQEEADIRKTNGDYIVLSTTIINALPEDRSI